MVTILLIIFLHRDKNGRVLSHDTTVYREPDGLMPQPQIPAYFKARATGRMRLIRWFSAVVMLGLPQASAPIAFAFLSLTMTGETAGGAGLMLAMTIAQVVGAVPITRLGKGLRPTHYLQILLAIRSLALIATAFAAYSGMPFHWLIPFILVAGSVNGAIHGYFRAILNQLTPLHRLPRALGIASTINEISFVLGPVLATGLATRSPILTVVVLGLVGLLPAVLTRASHSRASKGHVCLSVPTFTLSMLWHPRMDGDLAHRWLRGHIRAVCSDKPA